jgi:hypothetical protein
LQNPFVASGIVTEEQAAFLTSQPEIAASEWLPCFDSDTDDASTPAVFHAQCDEHAVTVSIASNSLGYVFGGYAERSWSYDTCCADSANSCQGTFCTDHTASGDFLFGLGPSPAERFDPTGANTLYQYARIEGIFPSWGGSGNLQMGSAGPPGTNGECAEGATFAGSLNQICGGFHNWGETRLVVFFAPPSPVFAVASYITAEHDTWLQSQPAIGSEGWTVCYDSATDCTDQPSCFHTPCDGFSETVSIARNSLGYTFGGYVRRLFKSLDLSLSLILSA